MTKDQKRNLAFLRKMQKRRNLAELTLSQAIDNAKFYRVAVDDMITLCLNARIPATEVYK